ncbi:MAG: ThuA domain-containing protein [Actinomycetota bacterium]
MVASSEDGPRVRRALVLAGGWMHPPDEPVAAVRRTLATPAWDVAVVTEPAQVADAVGDGCDLLVVASCWFSMTAERYTDDQRAAWAVHRDARRESALASLADGGVPVLALHTAVICFDGWPLWRDWLGGVWSWDRSWHPEPRPMSVRAEPGAPVESTSFEPIDEEYTDLDIDPAVVVVARSAGGQPLVWVHEAAGRRAAVSLLGHDHRSLDHPEHRRLLRGLVDHLTTAHRGVA